jgi:DNA polymerase III alpha subunit
MPLSDHFRRPVPSDERYRQRVAEELALVEQHRLEPMFLRVREILDLMPDVSHNIRGSAGSSLLCYLLRITDIDPIAWEIPITRFMHHLRADAPDIDIDVPYTRREEWFEKVFAKYGNRVARVSNRVHRKGVFHNWALHCGGIVILDHAIPSHMLLRPGQLNMNKDDVEKAGLYKIDLLSSHALAQLDEVTDRPLFEYPREDELAASVLASGKSIGIIGGESPAFRKAAMSIGVTRMEHAVLATSLIRPAAAEGAKGAKEDRPLVFEDDVIAVIAEAVKCSPAEADVIRRAVAKGRAVDLEPELLKRVQRFRAYAFCKSHGVAYGAVVWALAWHKARNPEAFWKATLRHAQPIYRKWVHPHEAAAHISTLRPQSELFPLTSLQQWRQYGYWSDPKMIPGAYLRKIGDGLVTFRGPIATARNYTTKAGKKLCFLTVGVGDRDYITVTHPTGLPWHQWGAAEGTAKLSEKGVYTGISIRRAWMG